MSVLEVRMTAPSLCYLDARSARSGFEGTTIVQMYIHCYIYTLVHTYMKPIHVCIWKHAFMYVYKTHTYLYKYICMHTSYVFIGAIIDVMAKQDCLVLFKQMK